jgi:hypothetical protein
MRMAGLSQGHVPLNEWFVSHVTHHMTGSSPRQGVHFGAWVPRRKRMLAGHHLRAGAKVCVVSTSNRQKYSTYLKKVAE